MNWYEGLLLMLISLAGIALVPAIIAMIPDQHQGGDRVNTALSLACILALAGMILIRI